MSSSDSSSSWQPATKLGHLGRPPEVAQGTVNPPVVRASTLLFPTVAELKAVNGTLFTYGRHGTDTTRALESALATLEGAHGAMLTPSGLSAISTALLALVQPGDHILVTDSVYEPARAFCSGTLKRLGVETEYYDPNIGGDIARLIRPNTRLIYTESPGSHTFEVQDIPAIVAAAHARDVLVMLDNTWGTPLHFASFKHGVDISVHAATKYIVGHSDVFMGVILTTEALWKPMRHFYKELGQSVSGDDAYTALRGLRTLSARLAQHQASTMKIAQWLQTRPEVAEVLYPALPGARGHEIWKRDFTGACGLFGVIFQSFSDEAVAAMLDGLKLFGMGYSWGGFESLAIPSYPKHMRTATQWEAPGPMIRIHIGLEAPDDLIADLAAGLDRLRATDGK